jgi:hypothetical protein
MNESKKPLPPLPENPGAIAPAKNNAPVASPAKLPSGPVGNSAPGQPAIVSAPASKSVPLFGGHRGGGKKRADGLPAGSPAAIEADRGKNAKRMRDKRAAEKLASLPPPLPGVATSLENKISPLAGDQGGVRLPVDFSQAAPATLAPAGLGFVAWTSGLLKKPAALLTRIADRFRCSSLMKRVKKLGLTPAQEKEFERDIAFKEKSVEDFAVALSESATVILNTYNVPGSQHSHFVNLAMTGGELVAVHLSTLDKLEKLIAENKLETAKPSDAKKN